MSFSILSDPLQFLGAGGQLPLRPDDVVARHLAMLVMGECSELPIAQVADQFGYCRQRYYQLLAAFTQGGSAALQPHPTGPKTNYRRTPEIVRRVISQRFLDPDCSADVITQKLRQKQLPISQRSVERIIADYGLQKKLYALNPAHPPRFLPTERTQRAQRDEPCDPMALEHQVRQLLADKISGNQVGIWLLLPELLRLGAWELLCSWTGQSGSQVEPRLALHLVNESALCLCSMRRRRSLSQKGFELANGLPFVPTDAAIHQLLAQHSVRQAQQLQVDLGKLRRAGKHFDATLLAIDPHRLVSYSKRQMRRHRFTSNERARKMAQTFFLLDCRTHQPLGFTLASAATTATHAAQELLAMAAQILNGPSDPQLKPLVLADKEHCSHELFESVVRQGLFDLLVAMPARKRSAAERSVLAGLPFTEQWPGFATVQRPFHFYGHDDLPLVEFIQRTGVRPADYLFESFLGTRSRDEVQTLTEEYPDRWHIEEFFKHHQALGWDRAGTLNLNVRYAQMTLALIAQAALHQLRQRLGPPVSDWDASHLAEQLFCGLEGDVRVQHDTLVVTLYNAPNVELLRRHYEHLPAKLRSAGVDPKVPWLYDFELDFRFR